ncbi:MAG: RidA family protein [Planctomycetes bacterium]|nr:RidA family protein [Planctomycetota bacterium]
MPSASQVVTAPGLSRQLPFSHAVRAGPLVFLSGQASIDEHGQVVADGFENEMRRTLGNLRQALVAAGLDLKDVVSARGYLRDEGDFAEYNRIWRECLPEPYPTRTTVMRCLSSAIRVEIEAIAYDPRGTTP